MKLHLTLNHTMPSNGSAFREFIDERLDKMGFKSIIADPDVWIRPATKPDGEQYYEFILVYVEDMLAISQDSVSLIRGVAEKLKLKKHKIEPPENCLRG